MDGTWQFHPIFIPLIVSVLLAGAIAAYSFRYRTTTGATALGTITVASAWWSALYLLQLAGTSVEWQLFWLRLSYVGVSVLPPAWLAFALQYADSRITPTRKRIAIITVPSVLLSAMVMANPLHGLAWTVTGITESPLVVVQRELHLWYYAHVAYSYLLVLLGMSVLLRRILRLRRVLRIQGLAIFAGAAVSLAPNIYWVLGGSVLNYTSIAFAASGVLFAVALFRYRLLDLVPVARDTVVEEMRDAYVVLDKDRRIIDLNPAAQQLLSSPDDSIGCHLSTVAPPIDDLLEDVQGDSRQDTTVVFEVDGDGTHRYLEVRASPLAEGESGMVVTIRDATERQRAQRRFQSSIEHASDVIAVLDEEGRIEYVSPPIEELTGHSPDALIGKSSFDLVDDVDLDSVKQTFSRICELPGGAERFEARISGPGDDPVVVEGIGRNLLNEPFVEGIVLNLRDITERTKRERKLSRANERLERFASVVSHDLRNPLNIASGHLELARETGDDAHTETAQRALERMDDIIQDALSLARHGQIVEDPTPVRLGNIASLAWDVVVTDDAQLTIESDGTIAADPDRLRRLFENLVRNAFEHGGDDINLWVGTTDDGFYVEDSGMGIPEDKRDDVFESGFSTNSGGTGLGLAIVAEIVDAHGWDIYVEHGRDGGARFVVSGASVDIGETATQP
ncbi:PAS domain S-box protein [Haloferax mediterranei ATCC 33500]|uniref:histidine kinase n=3 Tax=Haloferacaceae TaxID=1644056 RepID=I3R3N9_HALMT|nr:histidine kinase N-terminal 7TM domain-containing protein [Haloferax mediterranei]AFK18849.1 HTR-like protein [Haloferax mediterranei ATCC 33500]AHZ21786.1 HTR-like protein [Haloferax mediterranei ATCC 33500]EMA03293.1 HTR-like protein [Haloferax mediterranei ATCC 33500]MDX5988942.1 histidine kinase N-terminal 7TM domain-containing protein [Haloferax mediterranei ATCC 33500]QCQ75337.1 PAS domain S-box protein [Haloferax mediterranei ATCC 33500]